jgi:hypothetical protein
MPVDRTKIHQGPGRIWFNCAVPTVGNRLLIDASGEPTQGSPIEVGATEGAVTLALAPKLEQIMADQVAAPIDVVMTGEAESIEVTLKESDLAKLTHFVQHGTFGSGTDAGLPAGSQVYEEITFGGVIPIPQTSIAVISVRRDAPTKYVVSQLYNAYQADAVSLPFARGKETTFKVKFEGLADPSRTNGDMVGRVYRQI